jgi:hypothetical protein
MTDEVPVAAEAVDDQGGPAASVRGPELGVALLLLAIALLVIGDSLRTGIGWADDGPKAGYFPFYIGLLLLGASGFIAVSTLLKWRQLTKPFVMREEFKGVLAVLSPTLVYVAVLAWTGIYLASVLLIAYFMRRHGKYGWRSSAVVSIGVMLVFFLVFERWFLVPLPKGPIEAALGF